MKVCINDRTLRGRLLKLEDFNLHRDDKNNKQHSFLVFRLSSTKSKVDSSWRIYNETMTWVLHFKNFCWGQQFAIIIGSAVCFMSMQVYIWLPWHSWEQHRTIFIRPWIGYWSLSSTEITHIFSSHNKYAFTLAHLFSSISYHLFVLIEHLYLFNIRLKFCLLQSRVSPPHKLLQTAVIFDWDNHI